MSDWKAKPAPPAEPYVRGDYSCNLIGPHDPHMWIDTTKRRPVSCPGTPDPDMTECPSCHATAGRPHTEYCKPTATGEDPMTPYERDSRIEALRRRGLIWQLGSDLSVANDPALLAKVEALPDRELAALNRLDASWRSQ